MSLAGIGKSISAAAGNFFESDAGKAVAEGALAGVTSGISTAVGNIGKGKKGKKNAPTYRPVKADGQGVPVMYLVAGAVALFGLVFVIFKK